MYSHSVQAIGESGGEIPEGGQNGAHQVSEVQWQSSSSVHLFEEASPSQVQQLRPSSSDKVRPGLAWPGNVDDISCLRLLEICIQRLDWRPSYQVSVGLRRYFSRPLKTLFKVLEEREDRSAGEAPQTARPGEDKVKAALEVVKATRKVLECPVCYLTCPPPRIWQCNNGHLTCHSCHSQTRACPLCRTTFSSVRPLAAERLAAQLPGHCKNQSQGCPVSLPGLRDSNMRLPVLSPWATARSSPVPASSLSPTSSTTSPPLTAGRRTSSTTSSSSPLPPSPPPSLPRRTCTPCRTSRTGGGGRSASASMTNSSSS